MFKIDWWKLEEKKNQLLKSGLSKTIGDIIDKQLDKKLKKIKTSVNWSAKRKIDDYYWKLEKTIMRLDYQVEKLEKAVKHLNNRLLDHDSDIHKIEYEIKDITPQWIHEKMELTYRTISQEEMIKTGKLLDLIYKHLWYKITVRTMEWKPNPKNNLVEVTIEKKDKEWHKSSKKVVELQWVDIYILDYLNSHI